MGTRQFDLGDRLLDFAASIGTIVRSLPNDRLGTHMANQLIRSGTAPAAHHAEAQSAESRRDFIHKLKIGLKELRETLFWLCLARKMEMRSANQVATAVAECDELIAIFVKSIETARRNSRN